MGRGARAKLREVKLLKLDLGCGPRPREGFEGVDRLNFDGKVTHLVDLTKTPWPWKDNSVAEAHCSHFIEHLTAWQRVAFCNELHRILVPGGTCQFIVPHWASCRAYGDPTHQWPPISEFWFLYLDKNWRANNAPHTDIAHEPKGFSCHFEFQYNYNLRPDLATRSLEYQQDAAQNYKEVLLDFVGVLKAVK